MNNKTRTQFGAYEDTICGKETLPAENDGWAYLHQLRWNTVQKFRFVSLKKSAEAIPADRQEPNISNWTLTIHDGSRTYAIEAFVDHELGTFLEYDVPEGLDEDEDDQLFHLLNASAVWRVSTNPQLSSPAGEGR